MLVVSHKATLRILISSLLGFDARGYRDRLDQSPACLNVVDFKDPVRARLMLFNDVSHYQDTAAPVRSQPLQVVGRGAMTVGLVARSGPSYVSTHSMVTAAVRTTFLPVLTSPARYSFLTPPFV